MNVERAVSTSSNCINNSPKSLVCLSSSNNFSNLEEDALVRTRQLLWRTINAAYQSHVEISHYQASLHRISRQAAIADESLLLFPSSTASCYCTTLYNYCTTLFRTQTQTHTYFSVGAQCTRGRSNPTTPTVCHGIYPLFVFSRCLLHLLLFGVCSSLAFLTRFLFFCPATLVFFVNVQMCSLTASPFDRQIGSLFFQYYELLALLDFTQVILI